MRRSRIRDYDELQRILVNSLAKGKRWSEEEWPVRREVEEVNELVWERVGSFCSAGTLTALAASSTGAYRSTRRIVPGLKEGAWLYPHQINGLSFALRVERSLEKGGLLCCEPGLGKTLVSICLMLKTARLRARSPKRIDGRRMRHKIDNFGHTLIVVPTPLLGHWRQELEKWCGGVSQGSYLINTELGTIFIDDGLREDATTSPWARARSGKIAWQKTWPQVVLTSDTRLSLEFGLETRTRLFQPRGSRLYLSPLRQTSWLRIIVDEGQHRGALASNTNVGLILDSLSAERRWLITGTPVTQRKSIAAAHDALKQLEKLFKAVGRHPKYHKDKGRENNLEDLCDRCLIRHETCDLMIPQPKIIITRLPLSTAETESLNAFVSFIKTNLLLTSIEVDDLDSMRDGFEVSLLNPKNRASALQAIRNIILTCAGGGKMLTQIDPLYMAELKRLLQNVHHAPPQAIDRVCSFVTASTTHTNTENTACDMCALALKYLLVTPCGHTICPECIEAERGSRRCPACLQPFQPVRFLVSDDKQAHPVEIVNTTTDTNMPAFAASGDISSLPPGYQLRCSHVHGWGTRNDENSSRCEKQHTKWRTETQSGVDAFVWLQPGIELKWHETQLEAEAEARANHFIRQSNPVHTTTSLPQCLPAANEALDQHSKAYHIVKRLEEAEERRYKTATVDKRPIRAIIFSEDRRVLDWIGHYLVLKFGEDHVFQHFGKYRADELEKYSRGVARGWLCPSCGFRNEDSTALTCAQKFLVLSSDQAALSTVVKEEYIVGHRIGKQYSPGEHVLTTDGSTTLSATIQQVKRCGRHRPGGNDCLTVRSLPVDGIRILLLSKDGRHGLSLPETTHIFLVSTIWEPSVEQQVIRRAARIGATHPVTVEQLLGQGSPEEELYAISHDQANHINDDQGRITTFLKRLTLLRAPPLTTNVNTKKRSRVSFLLNDSHDNQLDDAMLLSEKSIQSAVVTPCREKMRRTSSASTTATEEDDCAITAAVVDL